MKKRDLRGYNIMPVKINDRFPNLKRISLIYNSAKKEKGVRR